MTRGIVYLLYTRQCASQKPEKKEPCEKRLGATSNKAVFHTAVTSKQSDAARNDGETGEKSSTGGEG